MALYWCAGIAIGLILIGSALVRAIPGFIFICTRDGTTMVSAPGKFPTACRDGHRIRMLFPAPAYAAMMFVGDLAMCTLIAHFILQPYIPSALPFIVVFAASAPRTGVTVGLRSSKMISGKQKLTSV